MESITYLWSDGNVKIQHADRNGSGIVAEDFQLILNSPTILQCRDLTMDCPLFSFKDYSVLHNVKIIRVTYDIDPAHLAQFLEQPGVKPIVVMLHFDRANIDNVLDHFCKVFSSAVVPSPLKIVFDKCKDHLAEFLEINKTSGEKLEFKKGVSAGYERFSFKFYNYTLERSSI
ncbi:hypothetical protein DdX_17150 [Ditylenchus destructor]|uniref:Uncharacterized protein n=1 Tax=Ditylenchus destructor TaxID=166010 RepID=A0AAD4QZ91_9BILA|nr:hypothetical protein DdX_17150 [Ditylenchus destructor]